MALTKEMRADIVGDFAGRHEGRFQPRMFLDEVRATRGQHPAWEWFEWDDSAAAESYRLEQARNFVRDLKVTFTIEDVGGAKMVVRSVEAPLMLSPLSGRAAGGGYVVVEALDRDTLAELAMQAATDLKAWADRYEAVLSQTKGAGRITTDLVAMLAANGRRVTAA